MRWIEIDLWVVVMVVGSSQCSERDGLVRVGGHSRGVYSVGRATSGHHSTPQVGEEDADGEGDEGNSS